MKQEEFQALTKHNPFDALAIFMDLDIFSSKTDTEPSVDVTIEHPDSIEAGLIFELRTKILGVDLFQQIEQDESVVFNCHTPFFVQLFFFLLVF